MNMRRTIKKETGLVVVLLLYITCNGSSRDGWIKKEKKEEKSRLLITESNNYSAQYPFGHLLSLPATIGHSRR